MTTPENPDEGQTPEDTPETTPKKTTRRTRKTVSQKIADNETAAINDAETLKDTQQINEQATEQLGTSVNPGRHLYQTSQFDVQSQNPSVLDHLAYPSEAAVKAQEASDARFKQEEQGTGEEEQGTGD